MAHHEDAEVLTLVAQVALQKGLKEEAANLLIDAARVDDYRDPVLVQRAVIALIGVGRLFDAFAFLERCLDHQPDQVASRRTLFDLYRGAGNYQAALPHGRKLVRDRRFDFRLLAAISSALPHSLETQSMDEMVARNPEDNRPRLAEARVLMEQARFLEAQDIVDQIVKRYPRLCVCASASRSLAGLTRLDRST